MNPSKERVLLFDFDGVIADSLDHFDREFGKVLCDLGYPHLASRDALLRLFEGNIITGLVKAGFPFYRLKKLGEEFGPRLAETMQQILPFTGMPELLNSFAQRFPTYVITSNLTEATTRFLQLHAVSGVRDVLGADKESSKVKKIRQVRKLHRGATAYYIGDTKGDMLEAAEAGAVPVAVTWGWHPEETLLQAKPKHVVRSPRDLVDLFADTERCREL